MTRAVCRGLVCRACMHSPRLGAPCSVTPEAGSLTRHSNPQTGCDQQWNAWWWWSAHAAHASIWCKMLLAKGNRAGMHPVTITNYCACPCVGTWLQGGGACVQITAGCNALPKAARRSSPIQLKHAAILLPWTSVPTAEGNACAPPMRHRCGCVPEIMRRAASGWTIACLAIVPSRCKCRCGIGGSWTVELYRAAQAIWLWGLVPMSR